MDKKDMKRLQIYEDHIAQLRAAAEDDSLTKEWKLYSFREIFRALGEALRELED